MFDRRVRGGPILGSAWRCFWAYGVQPVLGTYGAHSALGAHGALGALGAHGALGALGALGARGPHGAPSLHSPRFLSVSNPLAFPPQKRTPGEGTMFLHSVLARGQAKRVRSQPKRPTILIIF